MDYNKQIETLQAWREELKAELQTKEISEQERLAIRHSIDVTNERITTLSCKLADTPAPTPFWRQTVEIVTVVGSCGWMFISWYYSYPFYASWRHSRWKFSQSQIDCRRQLFHPNFPVLAAPASMRMSGRTVGNVCGATAACLWFLKSRRRSPPSTPPQQKQSPGGNRDNSTSQRST